MTLVLYSDGSHASDAAKAFLSSHGMEFEEVDARTSDGYQRLVKRTQQKTVPAIEIKRSHCVQIIVGFNEQLLAMELRLK
ncbi:MAG: glutaredoxin domain-containing protein [Candidatus Micrarchaeota archaeon]